MLCKALVTLVRHQQVVPFDPALPHERDCNDRRAHLVCGAEAVLYAAHQAKCLLALALHIEDGVDNVFKDPRARDVALFCDMAHQENGDALALGHMQQCRRTLPHLCRPVGVSQLPLQVTRLSCVHHV